MAAIAIFTVAINQITIWKQFFYVELKGLLAVMDLLSINTWICCWLSKFVLIIEMHCLQLHFFFSFTLTAHCVIFACSRQTLQLKSPENLLHSTSSDGRQTQLESGWWKKMDEKSETRVSTAQTIIRWMITLIMSLHTLYICTLILELFANKSHFNKIFLNVRHMVICFSHRLQIQNKTN